ncbi:MAG: Uma2 family endonuclease [Bacteroidota bacterium]
MTLHLKQHKLSVEQYDKMVDAGILEPEDKVELIEGQIITMSPFRSLHQAVVTALTEEIIPQLLGKYTVIAQGSIKISASSKPEPDMVIAKFRKDRYRKIHPTADDAYLVIEVSDSTLRTDRNVKLPLYARAKIAEYWIVDAKKEQIEQYHSPEADKYISKKIWKKQDVIKSVSIDFSLKVADLFL